MMREWTQIEAQSDFPVLQRKINGKPLIYLDNAATTQKPNSVINAISDFYATSNANVHRATHTLGEEATHKYECARNRVRKLLNAQNSSEIVFVRSATEAINLVSHSWGLSNVQPGDIILLTEMEHHSNLIPWQLLTQDRGARIELLGIDDSGLLKMEDLDRYLDERVRLLAITGMSNVLGTINPIEEVAKRAHEVGALVLVDGAQSVPHLPVDVQALDCDFLVCSGHKMLGPTGIGVLYARQKLLREMPPFMSGGEMIKEVSFTNATWSDPPSKFEAGTPPIAQAIGFGAAIEYLQKIGLARVHEHECSLVEYAMAQFREIPGLEIYGPGPDHRGGILSFNLNNTHPHDLAAILDEQGIAIRAGHHCAQPLINRLGVRAMARASFYLYNTFDEVDRVAEALLMAKRILTT